MPRRKAAEDILHEEQIRATNALNLSALGQPAEIRKAIEQMRQDQIDLIDDFLKVPKRKSKHTRKPTYSYKKKSSKNPKK